MYTSFLMLLFSFFVNSLHFLLNEGRQKQFHFPCATRWRIEFVQHLISIIHIHTEIDFPYIRSFRKNTTFFFLYQRLGKSLKNWFYQYFCFVFYSLLQSLDHLYSLSQFFCAALWAYFTNLVLAYFHSITVLTSKCSNRRHGI